MIINKIKEEMESLEELEFKSLNDKQKQYIRKNFNTYINFEYVKDDYSSIIFICTEGTFRNMEYFLGFEYENECIEYKLSMDNKVIVSYFESDRVENLYASLSNLEESEETV